MQYSEYQRIEKLENIHFWYRSMEEMSIKIIKKYFNIKKIKILDTGCGTGGMTKKLKQLGYVTGIDINSRALEIARKKGLKILKADVCKLPFSDNTFDLVTSFDVIYHQRVKDDMQAIKEMHRVLIPGGIIFIRVPALEFLRGNHDLVVQTRHRYTAHELQNKLESVGFKIEKLTYANMLFFIPLFMKRTYERYFHLQVKSDIGSLPKIINELFYNILKAENIFLNNPSLPFGSSLICIGRKLSIQANN